MSTSIGNQLSEARKRQGKSLRDVSEALKIKTDFLSNFENDRFDFDLPEVYMYGFLKLYAKYLKMDIKAVLADYSALKQINIHSHRLQESRELFGRMQLPKKPQLLGDPVTTHFKVIEEDTEHSLDQEEEQYAISQSKSTIKRWLVGGSIVAMIGIGTLIAIVFSKSETPSVMDADKPAVMQSISFGAQKEKANHSAIASQDSITLYSDAEVHIIVRQESNKQRLYSGTLSAKETKSIVREGPVKIHFSDGSSLLIKKANGEKVKPGRSGVGWIEVN